MITLNLAFQLYLHTREELELSGQDEHCPLPDFTCPRQGSDSHLKIPIFEDADPEGLLAVVECQHCLHSVHKLFQGLLQERHVVGQSNVLMNLCNSKM